MTPATDIGLFVLVGVANAAPIAIRQLLGGRPARPIDDGRDFIDGRPWLGPSKTWRGLGAAIVSTTLAAVLMDWSWQTGSLVAALAMAGDLASSFVKRRLGRPSGASVPGLDQIPESLLPALAARPSLDLAWPDVLAVTLAFVLAERAVTPLLYRLRLRRRT